MRSVQEGEVKDIGVVEQFGLTDVQGAVGGGQVERGGGEAEGPESDKAQLKSGCIRSMWAYTLPTHYCTCGFNIRMWKLSLHILIIAIMNALRKLCIHKARPRTWKRLIAPLSPEDCTF